MTAEMAKYFGLPAFIPFVIIAGSRTRNENRRSTHASCEAELSKS